MPAKELLLDRVHAALARVLEHAPEVAVCYAYGSRVHGRVLPLSDLDLAFLLARDAPHDDPLLAERLTARIGAMLETEVEIDGHIAEDLPLSLQGRIVTTGIVLFDRDPSRRVEFETTVRRLYFDFLPLLDRDAREALRTGG